MARDPTYEALAAARASWHHRGSQRPPWAHEPKAGQESVWDYPRPARCEATTAHLTVRFDGVVVADTRRGYRALETSHPPTYYFPPEDVRQEVLVSRPGTTVCEWKGAAHYWTIEGPSGRRAQGSVWAYPEPFEEFKEIAGYFAFYVKDMDLCTVNGAAARPQPGGFYAGWVTPDLAGPFKGDKGSAGW